MFDSFEYKISPINYVEQVNIDGHIFCYFLIGELQNSTLPTAILGDPFIRNYYILHDMESQRIGLYGGYMVYYPPDSNRFFKFFAIAACIGIILLGFILYIYTRDANRQAAKHF